MKAEIPGSSPGGIKLAELICDSHAQIQAGIGWTVDDAPRRYIDRLVKATVGIEIVIERLEGKWKAG